MLKWMKLFFEVFLAIDSWMFYLFWLLLFIGYYYYKDIYDNDGNVKMF